MSAKRKFPLHLRRNEIPLLQPQQPVLLVVERYQYGHSVQIGYSAGSETHGEALSDRDFEYGIIGASPIITDSDITIPLLGNRYAWQTPLMTRKARILGTPTKSDGDIFMDEGRLKGYGNTLVRRAAYYTGRLHPDVEFHASRLYGGDAVDTVLRSLLDKQGYRCIAELTKVV
jgi:hypothetical protein